MTARTKLPWKNTDASKDYVVATIVFYSCSVGSTHILSMDAVSAGGARVMWGTATPDPQYRLMDCERVS